MKRDMNKFSKYKSNLGNTVIPGKFEISGDSFIWIFKIA